MSMDYFNAFWFGGLVCALIQILLDKTKLMPGRVMVLLVCSGALLSAVGVYRPLVDFAGAGASVPLIGFGHVLWEGMKKAIEEDGILGLFYRRLHCLCCRSFLRPDLLLSGQSLLPSKNEKIIFRERSFFS
ncbi:SpoVA protein [Ruminococcus sp. SR1/5]|nr:SpoVA protein [Ruminococcus sp. SR1/5]